MRSKNLWVATTESASGAEEGLMYQGSTKIDNMSMERKVGPENLQSAGSGASQ